MTGPFRRAALLSLILPGLLYATGAAASVPVVSGPVAVDDFTDISYPFGARVARRTGNLNAPAVVKNDSTRTLFGPVQLNVDNVAPGVLGPLNPDGASPAGGAAFNLVPAGETFLPGQSIDVPLSFTPLSRSSRLNYDASVTANLYEVGAPGILPLALPSTSTAATLSFAVAVVNPENDTLDVSVAGSAGFAALNDNGTGGDTAAGDGVYGGTLAVDYTGLAPGDCLSFTATAASALQGVQSAPAEICVTAVPVGAAGAVTDVRVPIGDGEAVSDEALLELTATAAHPNIETRIAELATQFDFTPVGFIPPSYQVRFNTPFADAGAFLAALADLQALDEVVLAVPNIVATPLVFDPAASPQATPDTTQPGWQRINVGNAWHIARGLNVNVHVIDSGYDATHTDLDTANISGDADSDGHGTRVLGILAAEHGNSGLGISGVTIGAAITATDFLATPCSSGTVGSTVCGLNPTMGQLMAAIRSAYAAGAQVVSVQFGVPLAAGVTPLYMCPFIDDDLDGATEKRLLIASAGEGGSTPTNQFPAACNDGAFSGFPMTRPERLIAVAATERDSDNLWVGNPTGYTQDIAAPGVDITTTEPCSAPGCATLSNATGTSFAAPFVSGAAAAMISKGIDPDNVEALMQSSGANVTASTLKRLDMLAALQAGNSPPNAVTDNVGPIPEGSFIDINLLTNDNDPDDNAGHPDEIVIDSVQLMGSPANGVLGPVTNGMVRYTHTNVSAAGTSQADSFSYEVWDTSGDSDIATVNVSITLTNDAPTINITSPASGTNVEAGNAVNITGSASDEESGNLSGSIAWTSNLDGGLGTGASINPVLSIGTHTITASVSDGNTSVDDTITIVVNADQPPTVTIASPANGASFNQGVNIPFSATATDNEDNNAALTASISWSSNQDGGLGTGGTLNVSSLSVNTHIITASVTDSGGNTADSTITVTVNALGGGGTASIDGVISPGEYAGAVQVAVSINTPEDVPTPGTLFVQNDAQNLYVALRFARGFVDPNGNSFSVEFDSNNDGGLSSGDDGMILNPDLGYRDTRRISQAENPSACSSTSLCGVFDTANGGTIDGTAAFQNAGGFTVYEFAKPLDSTDNANDFSLAPGNTITLINMFVRMIGAGGSFPDDFGDTRLPDLTVTIQ